MSYFEEQYPNLRYPIAGDGRPGLRSPQLGAAHSVAAHFTLHPDVPALVSMPTGTGKTAVLMMTPFLLLARRVLVVTPSALVRHQVAEAFTSLALLREIGALPEAIPPPKVHEQVHRLSQLGDWENLRAFDVVIGAPPSVSPARTDVAEPPDDLFDLLLVDEAHHSPAPTWDALLRSFPTAKRVLFTATPFREDRQAIDGRFAYNFPMSEAYRQKLYSQINYRPVSAEGADPDEAVALAAADQLAMDLELGFKHRVLARTDSRAKADHLAKVYAQQTSLKMELIHGELGSRTVKNRIDALAAGTIDGLICVDMLGEGFDLPALKIAAIHDPHRSLLPTLQFIGRFTRVGEGLGPATFLAVPSEDLEIEKRRMYQSGAVWREIVHELGTERTALEEQLRELAMSFHTGARVEIEYRDLPIEGFVPQHHVKVYRLPGSGGIHLDHEIVVPPTLEIAFRSNSETLDAVLLLLREVRSPRWTTLPQLVDVVHDLVLVYFDHKSSLLFIHSSRRSLQLYEMVARSFTGGSHSMLSMSRINRVLAEMGDYEFFNIGMRRRAQHNYDESYRIIAGSNAQNVISPTDGRWYYRGHVFAAAYQDADNERINIGYSSSSKIWSNRSTTIDGFVQWCKELAHRIHSYGNIETDSPVDQLLFGVELTVLPGDIQFAEWNEYAYMHPRRLRGPYGELQLLDFDLEVDRKESRDGMIRLRLTGEELADTPLQFSLDYWLENGNPQTKPVFGPFNDYIVVSRDDVNLLEWFREYPPRLFLSNFAVIDGIELYEVGAKFAPFNFDFFSMVDWSAGHVDDPKCEFHKNKTLDANNMPRSVHDYLWWSLPKDDANEVVFYDHGPGEMADFVTLGRQGSELWTTFYHCKGAGGKGAGARVGDAYELAGQAAKSLAWLRSPSRLYSRMARRLRRASGGSRFHPDRGDLASARTLLEEGRRTRMRFQIVAVQPGFSRSELEKATNVTDVLAAANEYIIQHQCEPLLVWGSE